MPDNNKYKIRSTSIMESLRRWFGIKKYAEALLEPDDLNIILEAQYQIEFIFLCINSCTSKEEKVRFEEEYKNARAGIDYTLERLSIKYGMREYLIRQTNSIVGTQVNFQTGKLFVYME